MILTKEIDYMDGETLCRGFIAYNNELSKPVPGIMVAHDWGGRGVSVCNKARQLAQMGYVGFAIDMYGKAQVGHNKIEKRALLTPLMENRKILLQRIRAAFSTIVQLPQVDKSRIAGIGYCFGGLCVLDLIRSGAPVKGVISFHGLLTPPAGSINTPLNTKALILHGYDDPLVKPDQIGLFATEMTERNVDWQIHLYGHTEHSFTDPTANDDEMGLHYNETADKRSWRSSVDFLKDVLGA